MTPEQNRRRLQLDEPAGEWSAIKRQERSALEERITRLAKHRKAGEFFWRELRGKPETEAP